MCQALQDWKEELLAEGMQLGEERGAELGRAEGMQLGMERGVEALILDNQEENKTKEQIVAKLMKRFSLDNASANSYYDRFTS